MAAASVPLATFTVLMSFRARTMPEMPVLAEILLMLPCGNKSRSVFAFRLPHREESPAMMKLS